MNNDYLRVNSKETDDGIAENSFNDRQKEKSEKIIKPQTLTIFSLLKSEHSGVSWSVLNTRNLFSITLTTLSLAILLYFIAIISSSVIFLIMGSIVISFALPLCFIVFLFELNNLRNVSLNNICISITIGVIYYVVVTLCKEPLSNHFSNVPELNFFGDVILTAIDDILLFIVAYITAKLFKKDCIFGTMLIVVSVFSGYSMADTATKLIQSLFINVVVNAYGLGIYGVGAAIVSDAKFFHLTLGSFTPVLLKEGIFMTILVCLWAVICGTLVSIMTAPVKNGLYGTKSIYVLCFFIILMHTGVTMQYTSKFLSFVIYFGVLIISVIFAIRLLNYSLARTNFNTEKPRE